MQPIRQGDIYLRPVDETPEDLEDRGTPVVAEGEATGHAHRLTEGTTLIEPSDEEDASVEDLDLYVEVPDYGAELVHDEHDAIELEGGTYEVIHQREHDPTEDLNTSSRSQTPTRRVRD